MKILIERLENKFEEIQKREQNSETKIGGGESEEIKKSDLGGPAFNQQEPLKREERKWRK